MSGAVRGTDLAVEASRLVHRLETQLAQLRQALMARPWQAPELKDIARLLEGASRSAFADEAIWGCVSHGTRLPCTVLTSLRPDGLQRAADLLDLAAKRVERLQAD